MNKVFAFTVVAFGFGAAVAAFRFSRTIKAMPSRR
jgi:hypothetical protein